MSRVVREELREMDMDIELQEEIYAEIEEEILQWLVSTHQGRYGSLKIKTFNFQDIRRTRT